MHSLTTANGGTNVLCPHCGKSNVWFGESDKKKPCPGCGRAVKNPAIEKVGTK